ncbi:PI3-kinase family, p85-binding domain-containing protein [Ditylenchus destructor]|nr:PI3-kinase family, p85-binding domain-containing protein [Ditylenchus destructor]
MEEKKVEKRPKKIGPVKPPQTPGASEPTSTPNTSKHHVKMHPSTPHGHPDGHPANYYYSEDQIWGTNEEGDLLSISQPSTKHAFLDVFMPNGFLIPIQCPLSRTLAQLKQDIFIQGRKLPLSSHIKDISNYIFSTIGIDGVHLELYDEHKPVSSLHQCLPLLILREPDGNTEEKELAQNIGTAMGICLTEIEKHISEESRLFRLKLFETCKKAEAERGVHGLEHYAFPEEPLLPDKIVPPNTGRRDLKEIHELDLDYVQYPEEEAEDHALERLRQKIKFYGAYVEIWFRMDESKLEYLKPIQIRDVLEKTPSEVIHMSLRELKKYYNISETANDFILQIAGRTVFVTQEVFITQFQYIRSCFENYRIPKLILRRKQAVFKHYQAPPKIFEPSYVRKEKHSQYFKMEKDRQQTRVFWDLDDNLKVKILSASQLSNLAVGEDIFIRVSVAVGRHILDVKDVEPVSPSNPRWKLGTIEFDVYLKDIPECTQLCFSLISLRKKKSRVELKPIGWMNLYIFDWRHHLVQGKQSLNLWPFPKGCTLEDVTFLSGAYAFNFNDATVACRIEIELPEYEAIIEYPNQPIIDKFIKVIEAREAEEATTKPKINKFVPGNPDLDRVLLLRRTLGRL